MRRSLFAVLVIAVASAIHVDWHFARPAHHRLSLEWNEHWLFGVAAFGIIGWLIARFSDAPVRHAIWIVLLGAIIGQGIEPVITHAIFEHALGYPVERERWLAFAVFVAAGSPALMLTLWLCRPRRTASAGLITPA